MPKIKNNEIEPEVLNNALIMRFRNSITALSNRDFKVIIASSAATLVFVFLLSLLGIDLGFKGPNYSVSTACATASYAIELAAEHIRNGEADLMVCGGAEAPRRAAPPDHRLR